MGATLTVLILAIRRAGRNMSCMTLLCFVALFGRSFTPLDRSCDTFAAASCRTLEKCIMRHSSGAVGPVMKRFVYPICSIGGIVAHGGTTRSSQGSTDNEVPSMAQCRHETAM